jgi:hypothetical protein
MTRLLCIQKAENRGPAELGETATARCHLAQYWTYG